MGKALGKKGNTIRTIQKEFRKKIKLIEFNKDLNIYLKNVIYPLSVEEISLDSGSVLLKQSNKKTKGLLIGRNGMNLKAINRAVKRFFPVDDVKII